MPRSEILYVLLFLAVFPALWILAAVLDRFLPSDSRVYSPHDERKLQSEGDVWRLEQDEDKQGQKEATKSDEAIEPERRE